MILSYLKNGKVVTRAEEEAVFERDADVLVIGLGASGCYAAIAAALT